MLRAFGSRVSAAAACLIVGGLFFTCEPAAADSPVSSQTGGGSVIITATIAPVRDVLVDNHGVILEILSNTSDNVAPTVYKNRLDTDPIPLEPGVAERYDSLIRRVNTHKTGVIYRLSDEVRSVQRPYVPKNKKNKFDGAAAVDTVKLLVELHPVK